MFRVYYMKMIKCWKLSLIVCFSTLLVSCVGTVQESNSNITDIGSAYNPVVSFSGIHTATAISDTKVEVFFYPASGGSGKYIYDLYVGNNPTPISIPSDILKPDYRGLLRTTVTDLARMNTYVFTMQARDQKGNGISTNVVPKSATTFTNRVSDFLGVSSATNMPGQDGKDSLLFRFTPASDNDLIFNDPWDPKTYELVVVDAERLTPADMDYDLTSSQGRWVFQWAHDKDNTVNQYVAKGLLPKRKYYARIRVIHNGSVEDIYNPHLRSELNTNYVEISTLSDELADIDFDRSSLFVSILSGSLGLTSVRATWKQVEGVFDHFRLYYSKKGEGATTSPLPALCLTETQSDPLETIFCKKVSYLSTSTQITGLIPYTEYEFVLLVCQKTTCIPTERLPSTFRYATTDPATIFNGVLKLESSGNLDGSQSIKVFYEDPNIIGGYFDGLILKMRRTLDGSDSEVEITDSTFPVYHRPFDPMSTTEIKVDGIDYLTTEPYCFRLYPYKWNDDGTQRREITNENWKCIIPKIEPPTAQSFIGVDSGSTQREYVTVKWSAPETGFYTNYVLFWRSGTVFNWGEALAAFSGTMNSYDFLVLDAEDLEYTLSGFPNGQYVFGVLTYHLYISNDSIVEKWSETNTRFLRCTVNNSSAVNVDCTF